MRILILIISSLSLTLVSSLALSKDQEKGPIKTAIFAGGCFWCMEPPFEKKDGVISAVSGYISGHVKNPNYKQVSAGTTGHTEAVEIKYDASKISYKELLKIFWKNIDPTVKDQQFCDRGSQYRSGIYYLNDEQKQTAMDSLKAVEKAGIKPIHTEIVKASTFYKAEEYHQDYYKKNPVRYQYYRYGCGRDARLKEIWGAKKLQLK
ncbi:MAG: peptide-methionine (S)-S-oxide reductase MsrA [Oligoflexales bacterium]|nr:peptide-methionine (S)-S-oxide reductase MsrA [Oligoflexales bacterium]